MHDEEDESFGGAYTDGHWAWDDAEKRLLFVSDLPPQVFEDIVISRKAPTGTIEFRDDIDVLEQMRFRRRYQRKPKPGVVDVVTLQDVKDLALYTASVEILSPLLIDLLHLPTTERFLRALIISCQFYLQVAEEMVNRTIELQHKVCTVHSDIIENDLRDDLNDIRLLVSKEYCAMLMGAEETKRFHHMGPDKRGKSLSDRDARLFETLLRMCVQIVWIALGRISFNQIELEVNRLFKTELYNSREHMLKSGYISAMTSAERAVLLGHSTRTQDKLTVRSPAYEAVFCDRLTDYRLYALGVIKYPQLPPRLKYMLFAIASPEEKLKEHDVTVGILGMERSCFDTMLQLLPMVNEKSKARLSNASIGTVQSFRRSISSKRSSGKSSNAPAPASGVQKIFPDVHLPHEYEATHQSLSGPFPDTLEIVLPCSEEQCRRWKNRLYRLLHPRLQSVTISSRRKSTPKKSYN